MSPDGDSERIEAYRAGDVSALDALVEKHRRPLFAYIMNMTGSCADADEVFQEVWFRVLRNLASYRDDNFLGWLMRIAHNHVIDRVRRRRPEVSFDADDEHGGPAFAAQMADPALDPARRATARDTGRRVAEAVRRLPHEQREVFIMRTRNNMSFKEIAAVQKVSINTALARMQYALAKLRSMLKEVYDDL